MKTSVFAGAAFIGGALSQQTAWGQCGGNGWSGSKSCVSGYTCTYYNDWYSQCVPGSPSPTTTMRTTTTSAGNPDPTGGNSGGSGKFKWLGVNEAGAEFGQDTYPGTWGKHFIFPDTSALQTLISEGFNIFRIPFAMERMAQDQLTNNLDTTYLQNLTQVVNFITNAGAYAILDPHNFGRYYGNIITDTNAFQGFWNKLANAYKSNSKVVFDTNNEYHDMDQNLVFNLNQAAINGIRAAGATSQYIFVEGNSWTGAWTWNVTNGNLANLSDPQNKLVYEMHQYLDSDGSGTSPNCVSSNVGVQRIVGATEWLKQNGKLGILGEFAGGANPQCETAVKGMLDHMEQNSDVWTGAIWWAGGPWWGDYMYGFEPPSSTAYNYYDSILRQYTP